MKFTYKAKDSNGAVKTGELEAGKEAEAVQKLRAEKLTVLEIAESGQR